ncbi:MAG: T9SS type A sorting domain-containing protein [Bacteroidota bacterium]
MRLAPLLAALLLFAAPVYAQSLVGLTSCCPNEVVTISASGDTTTVAAIGTPSDLFIATVGSVVLDAAGDRAFLVRNGRFTSIDLATGDVTEQASAGEIVQLGGFDASRGVLYALASRNNRDQNEDTYQIRNYLVAYDPLTQDTTHLAQVGEYRFGGGFPEGGDTFSTVTGPAIASGTDLHTIRNGRLVRVDLTTGAITEGTEGLELPEVIGTDGTWLYRTEREMTGSPALRTYTARLLRQPLAGGTDAPADTVSVFGRATINGGSGAVEGDLYIASFGIVFFDAVGDRLLLNRNGRLVSFDLDTMAARDFGPIGRLRLVPMLTSSAVATAPSARESTLTLGAAPNPASGPVGLSLLMLRATEATVAVYDTRGRRVATLHTGPLAAGTHALAWGAEAAPGVYLVRAVADGETTTLPVTISR